MSPRATIRDWARLIYYLSQNILSLVGVVLTTSSAITLIGFWVYDFMLPGPLRGDSALSDSSRRISPWAASDSSRNFPAAPQVKRRGRVAHGVPGD